MVSISIRARNDLVRYFDGLLKWSVKTKGGYVENHLSREHAKQLSDNILEECLAVDSRIVHFKTRYETHKKYGNYVHTYSPSNHRTKIYIIYNMDIIGNCTIKKITTNYKTI